jgi:hypothetical protein
MQTEIFTGSQARDEGMNRAVDHANRVVEDWSERAYTELQNFLRSNPGEFMCEDFRGWCAMIDFPLPPHARAFGGVIARAARAGLIKKAGIGQVKNVKAHCANANVWRRAA